MNFKTNDRILYCTSYNWLLSIVMIIFIGFPYFVIDYVNHALGFLYIAIDLLLVLSLFTHKIVIYEDRIEKVMLNRFIKDKVFVFNDNLFIEYRSHFMPRVPPEIMAFIKNNNSKKVVLSFLAPSKKKTFKLLDELSKRGVSIQYNI